MIAISLYINMVANLVNDSWLLARFWDGRDFRNETKVIPI